MERILKIYTATQVNSASHLRTGGNAQGELDPENDLARAEKPISERAIAAQERVPAFPGGTLTPLERLRKMKLRGGAAW